MDTLLWVVGWVWSHCYPVQEGIETWELAPSSGLFPVALLPRSGGD